MCSENTATSTLYHEPSFTDGAMDHSTNPQRLYCWAAVALLWLAASRTSLLFSVAMARAQQRVGGRAQIVYWHNDSLTALQKRDKQIMDI